MQFELKYELYVNIEIEIIIVNEIFHEYIINDIGLGL